MRPDRFDHALGRHCAARAEIGRAKDRHIGNGAGMLDEISDATRTLNVEPNISGELQIVSLTYNRRTSRFDAMIDLPSSTALHWQTTHYAGSAIETIDAVTA
jgi:hypothetical protein